MGSPPIAARGWQHNLVSSSAPALRAGEAELFRNPFVLRRVATATPDPTVMETNPREVLRRAVRRAVHRACWRSLEGDSAPTQSDLATEITRARAEHGDAGPISEVEVQSWITEDETEFDRAMLISDLVARRVHRTVAPVAVEEEIPVVPVSPEPVIAARPPTRTSPSIADLLDDMFSQQRTVAAAAPSR